MGKKGNSSIFRKFVQNQVPLPSSSLPRLVLFASGGGSNARVICEHFRDSTLGQVVGMVTNNPRSGIFDIGKAHQIPVVLIHPPQVKDGVWLQGLMSFFNADLLCLAGYLKLIPATLVGAYPRRIVNIHPSLLPSHGGRGMFGMNVHESVISSGDAESGITIHYVNEVYDRGEVLLQERLAVDPSWNAAQLQQAVLKLEHHWYPRILDSLCTSLLSEKV